MKFEEKSEIYDKLRKIAKDSKIVIITAVQMKRPYSSYKLGFASDPILIDYMDKLTPNKH
jgi:hypothetical protein